jgi:hypothetical protein
MRPDLSGDLIAETRALLSRRIRDTRNEHAGCDGYE